MERDGLPQLQVLTIVSIKAKCITCGEYDGLRVNFGNEHRLEKEFHATYKCRQCRDNESE